MRNQLNNKAGQMFKYLPNFLLVIGSIGLISLVGCEQNAIVHMKQDPFADKPETIRKGIPPEIDKEPPVPKPLVEEALRIDSDNFYTFREGVESEIVVSGRVLMTNTTFKLSIENVDEFKGANISLPKKLDPATGQMVDDPNGLSLKWKPASDFKGRDYTLTKRLVLRLITDGAPRLGIRKEIPVFVQRASTDPTFVKLPDLATTYTREGEVTKFDVVVKDPSSDNVDGARPRLITLPAETGPTDVSSLVYLNPLEKVNPIQDPNNPQNWIFKMVMDLSTTAARDGRGRNFTNGEGDFSFGLQAVSQFGQVINQKVTAKIRTSVLKPDVSWSETPDGYMEMIACQPNLLQFTVYDAYQEGKLTASFSRPLSELPGGAATGRFRNLNRNDLVGEIRWTPPAPNVVPGTNYQEFEVEFEVRNESRVPQDNVFLVQPFKRKIRVLEGGPNCKPVSTLPLPGPGPAPKP